MIGCYRYNSVWQSADALPSNHTRVNIMSNVAAGILFLLLSACSTAAQVDSFSIGGAMRSYLLHVPPDISHPPLLISMHGATGDGFLQQSRTGFDTIANRDTFIVVYPNGNYTSGKHSWNYSGSEDVTFLSALIDTLYKQFAVDRSRVYCSGFSLGGMMTYHMACSAADKIAAVVSVSGPDMSKTCTPALPVPVMHIHGLADNTINYSNAVSTVDGWVTKLGCSLPPSVADHYPATNPASKIKRESWSPCTGTSEVIFLSVEGGDHSWPNDSSAGFNASEEIWSFFKRHSLASAKNTAAFANHGAERVLPQYRAGVLRFAYPDNIRRVTAYTLNGVMCGSLGPTTTGVRSNLSGFRITGLPSGVVIFRIETADNRVFLYRSGVMNEFR